MSKINKTKATQIERYGGLEGYRAEMRRRRSLVKRYYLRDNPDKAKEFGKIKKDGNQTEESS